MTASTQALLDRVPNEQEIRAKLVETQREASLLRSLLRVAKKKPASSATSRQGEVANAVA